MMVYTIILKDAFEVNTGQIAQKNAVRTVQMILVILIQERVSSVMLAIESLIVI